jgi:hypothetical protein
MSTKVITYDALANAVGATQAATTTANTAAANATAYAGLVIPQASQHGGIQSLIDEVGRPTRMALSGDTTLPLNGQLIIVPDTHLVGTQGPRYFDSAQQGTSGAGGSILRGAVGVVSLIEVRGRGQYIPDYDITVDVGVFGAEDIELAGGYDLSGAGHHTGAVQGIAFSATAGPMRPILLKGLTARGFNTAISIDPRLKGTVPTSKGDAIYQTSVNNFSLTDSVLTGNNYALTATGISTLSVAPLKNNNFERGGRILLGDTACGGRIEIVNNLGELNFNWVRAGAGTLGAEYIFGGNQFEANTGYIAKFIGEANWRTTAEIQRQEQMFKTTDDYYVELTQLYANIQEPGFAAHVNRVQLGPDCRYRGLLPLFEMDGLAESSAPNWTYVLSPAREVYGQRDRNAYLGANGAFGSAASGTALTPLGTQVVYPSGNPVQPFDVGQVPAGGNLKMSVLVRSRTGLPVMTGLLVADGGGGYVPVNVADRIRVPSSDWHLLTVIVQPNQIMNGGQFRLTSADVEYTTIHVGVQGSDKLFRPWYPSA